MYYGKSKAILIAFNHNIKCEIPIVRYSTKLEICKKLFLMFIFY